MIHVARKLLILFILVCLQELDDERDREEKKKKKKAAKRRDKNKRKKNKDGDKLDGCGQLNGVVSNHVDEYDELDEEETKGDIMLFNFFNFL